MKIEVNKKKYEVRYCVKALVLYEQIVGHSFEVRNMSESIALLSAFLIACNQDEDLTFSKIMQAIDDDISILYEFQDWFAEEAAKQQAMMAEIAKKKLQVVKKTTRKKKE